jgi:hypothetical protein
VFFWILLLVAWLACRHGKKVGETKPDAFAATKLDKPASKVLSIQKQ